MSFSIKLWGVRGSLGTPAPPFELDLRFRNLLYSFFEKGHKVKEDIDAFLESRPTSQMGGYGGNTICVEVISPKSTLIIDAGSGIKRCGYHLMNGACGRGNGEVHLFLTHFHWDHLMGLPFFSPIFVSGNKIHIYTVQSEAEEKVRALFTKPCFPVPYDRLASDISFHHLKPREEFILGDISITPYLLDHPDPCWGYRCCYKDKVYSHCVDTEATRISREALGKDLPLYQNVDFMLFDSQYTQVEVQERVDWGHASANLGLDLGMREGVKKMAFVHFDPAASDKKIQDTEEQTRTYYNKKVQEFKSSNQKFSEVEWIFAREEMVFQL